MAKMTHTETETETRTTDDRLVAVLEQLQQNAPIQEIGFGHPKYQQRLRDEGFMDEFEKPVYQNGRESSPRGLSAQTRERASNLTAGTYLGGRVTVTVTPKGHVFLTYKSATIEDRMRQPWKSFEDLIDQLWAEMHPAPVVA